MIAWPESHHFVQVISMPMGVVSCSIEALEFVTWALPSVRHIILIA